MANVLGLTNSVIGSNDLNIILSNDKRLKEFISLYDFFKEDTNKKDYLRYINKLILKKDLNNLQIDNLYNLVVELDFYNKGLINLTKSVLSSKIKYPTKLNALLFLFNNRKKINKTIFQELNRFINEKTRNDLLKLLSSLNLYFFDDKYSQSIYKVISRTKYPTPFYLLLNCLEKINRKDLPDKKFMQDLIILLKNKQYNKRVTKELMDRINAIY